MESDRVLNPFSDASSPVFIIASRTAAVVSAQNRAFPRMARKPRFRRKPKGFYFARRRFMQIAVD